MKTKKIIISLCAVIPLGLIMHFETGGALAESASPTVLMEQEAVGLFSYSEDKVKFFENVKNYHDKLLIYCQAQNVLVPEPFITLESQLHSLVPLIETNSQALARISAGLLVYENAMSECGSREFSELAKKISEYQRKLVNISIYEPNIWEYNKTRRRVDYDFENIKKNLRQSLKNETYDQKKYVNRLMKDVRQAIVWGQYFEETNERGKSYFSYLVASKLMDNTVIN